MKKMLLAASVMMLSAPTVYAAAVSNQCADGKFSFALELVDGEVCSAEKTVTINDEKDVEFLAVSESQTQEIMLSPGDVASATISLRCALNGATKSLTSGTRTKDGCQGTLPVDTGNGGVDGNGTIDNGSVDGGDTGNGIVDNGNVDGDDNGTVGNGDIDSVDTGNGIVDNGNVDDGDIDNGNVDTGNTNGMDSDDEPSFASVNTLLCLDSNPCYDSNEIVQTIMEYGEERPLEVKFEQGENVVGLTHSEAMSIAQEYTSLSSAHRPGSFQSLLAQRASRGQQVSADEIYAKDLSDYIDPVYASIHNGAVVVILIKPQNKVIVRRNGVENARIELTYEAFIAAVKDARAKFSGEELKQSSHGKVSMINDDILEMVSVEVCVSTDPNCPGGSTSFSRERNRFVHNTFKYVAFRTILDRKSETKRDITHCEKYTMNKTDFDGNPTQSRGFVSTCAWTGGEDDRPDMVDVTVDPQVSSHREFNREVVNGETTINTREINIDIDGEDSITRDGNTDSDYDDWIFSGRGRYDPSGTIGTVGTEIIVDGNETEEPEAQESNTQEIVEEEASSDVFDSFVSRMNQRFSNFFSSFFSR